MADATAWISAPIHATASAWSTRVQSNGGAAPSANTLVSISNFCGALDAASIANLMISVNVFAPDNLIASITPLYKVYGNDPWTNHNFVAADLSVQGLKGNASTKYLDTGLIPTTIYAGSSTNAGLSAYNTMPDLGAGYEIACNDGTNSLLLGCDTSGNAVFWSWSGASNTISVASLTYGLGFFSGNRTDTTHANLYAANSTNAFASLGSTAGMTAVVPVTYPLTIFARNAAGTIQTYSSKRLSFAAVHNGLSSAQCQALYNAVQALRIAFGGGWL